MTEADLHTRIAVLDEQLKSSEKAMLLQAKEYERRLDALNHEQMQIAAIQNKYVPRETYATMESRVQVVERAQWAIGGGLIVLQIVMHYWK